MNSSKVIDISKSSLVGLKAELLKKQEEVSKIKELKQGYVKQVPKLKLKKKFESQISNKGVEDRSLKDIELIEDDADVLKKSREVLEAKSRLYDKLKESQAEVSTKSQYLIDFGLKHEIEQQQQDATSNKDKESSPDDESCYSDHSSDPENDWVDFVDTLGRSRRCLKSDLLEMKAKDAKLAASLKPPSPPPAPEISPELVSWDMQREIMRKKWEEQETLLLGKKDIHYQDVRFDEARPHGVGYFEFSVDENERLRQQQALKNLRNETLEQQEAAVGLRVRREQQLQLRLAAARKRRRERLGLPPDDDPDPQVSEVTVPNDEEEPKVEKIEDLEESIKKIAPLRPWDIGKPHVNSVMSQEEWVEKKRDERLEEFAPPVNLYEKVSSIKPSDRNSRNIRNNAQFICDNKIREKFNNPSIKCDTTTRGKCDVSSLEKRVEEVSYGPRLENRVDKVSYEPRLEYHVEEVSYGPTLENRVEEVLYGPTLEEWNSFQSNNVCAIKLESENKGETTKPTMKCRILTSDRRDALLSEPKAKFDDNLSLEDCQLKSYHNGSSVLSENKVEKTYYDHPLQQSTEKSEENNVLLESHNCRVTPEKYYKHIVEDQTNHDFGKLNHSHKMPIETIISNRFPDKRQSNVRITENEHDFLSTAPDSSKPDINWPNVNKRKRAEIAPPASMAYYTTDRVIRSKLNPSNSSMDLSDSISVGLNYLKCCTKENDTKKIKGLLDII